ncbi:hypothetical protein FRX31_029684, partial [Thalictrum thalictroides]
MSENKQLRVSYTSMVLPQTTNVVGMSHEEPDHPQPQYDPCSAHYNNDKYGSVLLSVVGSSIMNPIILEDMPDNSKPQPYHNSINVAQQDYQNDFNDNDFCTFGNLEPLCVSPSVIWDDDVGLMQDYSRMEYKETIADDDY